MTERSLYSIKTRSLTDNGHVVVPRLLGDSNIFTDKDRRKAIVESHCDEPHRVRGTRLCPAKVLFSCLDIAGGGSSIMPRLILKA